MDKLMHIHHTLTSLACEQMNDLERVNAKELGEVIDMIKDLEEAMYYHTIVESMHVSEE